ncbi:hypothetical protein KR009_011123 [Drosophila setifemur]|nr:hypothetical protein KR009_011123 [Drosophila setifemur]
MKPEQLNRLIRANTQMQPWLLRSTSELYESAVRNYYERSASVLPYSEHNRQVRQRHENAGPVRKLKKEEPTPSDNYPRSHRLQVDRAISTNSGQLMHTVIQASRRRSMSTTGGDVVAGGGAGVGVGGRGGGSVGLASAAAQPYTVYGQSVLSASSSSCSSASSGTSQEEIMGRLGPRGIRRSMARGGRKKQTLQPGRTATDWRQAEAEAVTETGPLDMGLFSARSLSLPPRPSAPGLGSWLVRQMPPSRQHHMDAMHKTAQAKAIEVPKGEADYLMVLDDRLKRRISVIEPKDEGAATRVLPELGQLLEAGLGSGSGTASGSGTGSGTGKGNANENQPIDMHFRFQTFGDRIKQFKYIHFADGPVTDLAFDRRKRLPGHKEGSPRTMESPRAPRRSEVEEQPRHLGYNNVLHSNHRQRSRSLETPDKELGSPPEIPLPALAQPFTRPGQRGSSLDSQSGSSFKSKPRPSTWAEIFAENAGGRSKEEGASRRSSTYNLIQFRQNSGTSRNNWKGSSVSVWPSQSTIPWGATASGSTSKRGAAESKTWRDVLGGVNLSSSSGAAPPADPPIISYLNRSARRFTPGSASKITPADNSRSKGPNRVNLAPVHRLKLQQRSLQGLKRDPLPLLRQVRAMAKVMKKPKTEKPVKSRATAKKQDKQVDKPKPKAKPKAKAKATRVSSNLISRSSHQAFAQPILDVLPPAGKAPKRSYRKQADDKLEKKPSQWRSTIDVKREEKRNMDKNLRTGAIDSSAPPPPLENQPAAHLKGANQLLVASATQVSAYKRAFRTQQQIIKADILQQEQRRVDQMVKHPTPPSVPSLQSRRGPQIPNSRAGVQTVVRRNGATETPLTEPLLATAAAKTVYRQKHALSRPQSAATKVTEVTAAKRAVTGSAAAAAAAAAAAKRSAKQMGERERGGAAAGRAAGGGGARAGATTTAQRMALTLAAQQQQLQSRNGSDGNGESLLGFRCEMANRSATALLQRRDESEQQLQQMSQSQSPSQLKQQQQQLQSPPGQQRQPRLPRRQFRYTGHPPWRPSY